MRLPSGLRGCATRRSGRSIFRAPEGVTGPWSVLDAINYYGLPMSQPRHRGPFIVQRFQRQTLQRWLVDHPTGLFPAETIVPVLGGELLRETGLIGGHIVQPHAPGQSAGEATAGGGQLSAGAG